MSNEQAVSLMLMIALGFLGFTVFTGAKRKAWQIAGLVWVAVWWLPPFVAVWIKGVFG